MRYDIQILMSCNASYILFENWFFFQETVTIAISTNTYAFLENALKKTVAHMQCWYFWRYSKDCSFLVTFAGFHKGHKRPSQFWRCHLLCLSRKAICSSFCTLIAEWWWFIYVQSHWNAKCYIVLSELGFSQSNSFIPELNILWNLETDPQISVVYWNIRIRILYNTKSPQNL